LRRFEVDQVDGGWSSVTDADIAGVLDSVTVVAGAFDHAWVAAVTSCAVQVSTGGDFVADRGE
jgi:hypothetical protein